jgi:hypothetical protein
MYLFNIYGYGVARCTISVVKLFQAEMKTEGQRCTAAGYVRKRRERERGRERESKRERARASNRGNE